MTYRSLLTLALLGLIQCSSYSAIIPFKLIGKSIVFAAIVNGVKGDFILDTGTAGIILNAAYFRGIPAEDQLTDIHGNTIDVFKAEVHLVMARMVWSRKEARIIPLDHLSRTSGIPILGLIGTQVFHGLQLTIDLDNLTLKVTRATKRKKLYVASQTPDACLEFIYKEGIPVIKSRKGATSLTLGLDTGASINMLNRRTGEKLAGIKFMDHPVVVRSLGKQAPKVRRARLDSLIVGQYRCAEMKFVLFPKSPFTGFDNPLNSLDGLIGYEFLKYFRTTINFRTRTIELYHRKGVRQDYLVAIKEAATPLPDN